MGRRNYTEEDIEKAIDDVRNGLSQRKAAQRNGIPRSTLGNRLSGTQDRKTSHEHLQKLSPEQEQRLRDWVLAQDCLGFPPTHAQIADFASRIAKLNGHNEPLGTHWIEAFLRRNPELKGRRGPLQVHEPASGQGSGQSRQARESPQHGRSRDYERMKTLWPRTCQLAEEGDNGPEPWLEILEHNARMYLSSRSDSPGHI